MSNETDSISLLARAFDQAAQLIDGLSPDSASLPTPCASWSVGQLVNHVIDDTTKFKTAARGEMPDWQAPTPEVTPVEWSGAFRSGAAEVLDTWRVAELDAPAPTPAGPQPLVRRVDQQIAELSVHTWDLARATGQPVDLDPEVGSYALQWGRRNLRPEFRGSEEEGKVFGSEVTATEDAPIYDQLAAWFGRNPRWSRPTV